MKCLLLAPGRYPFVRSISMGMEALGIEVRAVDHEDLFSARTNKLYNGSTALPRRVRNLWEKPYIQRTNAHYHRIFEEFRPELVFIYNDQLIQPDTLRRMKRSARVGFFLGDNPLYTPTNIHNLEILFDADHIITPDSFWREQLMRMGLDNVVVDHFGINEAQYQPREVTAAERKEHGCDLIYVGSSSKTNWGYKRALFLHLFRDMDLRAYISGGGMERWYPAFPGLAERIRPHDRFDAGFNNLVYNCAKVAPVEQVPSLFHGIHVRVFDTLGAGLLPLCEYSRDLAEVMEGIDVPMIRDYREAAGLAAHWIAADDERDALVHRMRERVQERYAPPLVIGRMMDRLFPAWL